MTTAPETGNKIECVELVVTGACQLQCTHCCTNSGPSVPPGSMALADWQAVIEDTARLGIPAVQMVGGEPTLYPYLPDLIHHALGEGLRVEVYSNLAHVRDELWEHLAQPGVSLATSYYTDDPGQHEEITRGRGSHTRTWRNIKTALRRGIPLRVGMVHVLDGQRIDEGIAELTRAGVDPAMIRVDRTRRVGRAAGGATLDTSELCGQCYRTTAAVDSHGRVYGCLMSSHLTAGNVREHRLADILTGTRWGDITATIPHPTKPCEPSDSSGCHPKVGPDCDPTWRTSPAPRPAVAA